MWNLAEADLKITDVVERAEQEGPQTLTREGRETAVLLSMNEYRRLKDRPRSMKEILMSMDLEGVDLERSPTSSRDVDL